MGELIHLDKYRDRSRAKRARGVAGALPRTFYFDLSCPFSYLAGERVERLFGDAIWRPAPRPISQVTPSAAVRAEAEHAAAALRLPLSWPERLGGDYTPLHRAALRAAELGRGRQFALAALRLGFCGGFDPDDELTLEEAAGAAGIPVEECLAAAEDARFDAQLQETSQLLAGAGVHGRPAIQLGPRFFEGCEAVAQASALCGAFADSGSRPAG